MKVAFILVVQGHPVLLQVHLAMARPPNDQHTCHTCATVPNDASKEPHGAGDDHSAGKYYNFEID